VQLRGELDRRTQDLAEARQKLAKREEEATELRANFALQVARVEEQHRA
jgi:hypothetical protein